MFSCMTPKQTQFTFIDLFCGIGSFHYSLKELGGECVLACDIDHNANSTYILNYGVVPQENIFDLQLEFQIAIYYVLVFLVKLFPI